jgi:hypothetical protein
MQTESLDPLGSCREGAFARTTGRPLPLIRTRIDVQIVGGLAIVAMDRTFTNAEDVSIEATITFPVPLHATLFALDAEIDGRPVTARAEPRTRARETYEEAVEHGACTVLHEEVLRGVHMLSVGHIPPGKAIRVLSRWVTMLSLTSADTAHLRIPLSVGDIYGRSPLADSDDLVHAGLVHMATLTAAWDAGALTLWDAPLVGGPVLIRLDRPIDMTVRGWVAGTLDGRMADGQRVRLGLSPLRVGTRGIDAAILFDGSRSMLAPCRYGSTTTKADVALSALRDAVASCDGNDRVGLYEFSDHPRLVARTAGAGIGEALGRLTLSGGGTGIGAAIDAALVQGHRDILVITDGKSHALDVQALAATGARFSAVLIGDDSLEARIGHLCALSGGEIVIASNRDARHAMAAGVAALRAARYAPSWEGDGGWPGGGRVGLLSLHRGGLYIQVAWTGRTVGDRPDDRPDDRPGDRENGSPGAGATVVGIMAAALAMPLLPPDEATALAVAHTIAGHPASLVLVDDAGERRTGLPATRKIPLVTPAVAARKQGMSFFGLATGLGGRRTREPAFAVEPPPPLPLPPTLPASGAASTDAGVRVAPEAVAPFPHRSHRRTVARLVETIDFSAHPETLRRGNFAGLDESAIAFIGMAVRDPAIAGLAGLTGAEPAAVVLALIARLSMARNRTAARFCRSVLAGVDPARLDAAARELGLIEELPVEAALS